MYTAMWIALVIAGAVVAYRAYCAYIDNQNAKLDAAVDEYNRQIDDDVRQRANVESGRTYTFNDNPRRIDDAQWRDWN